MLIHVVANDHQLSLDPGRASLQKAIDKAFELHRNEPLNAYVIRDAHGVELDASRTAKQLGLFDGEFIYLGETHSSAHKAAVARVLKAHAKGTALDSAGTIIHKRRKW